MRALRDIRFLIQDFEESFDPGHGHLDVEDLFPHVLEGRVQLRQVEVHHEQRAEREGPGLDVPDPEVQDRSEADRGDHADDQAVHASLHEDLEGGRGRRGVARPELLILAFLLAERLHDPRSAQRFLRGGHRGAFR